MTGIQEIIAALANWPQDQSPLVGLRGRLEVLLLQPGEDEGIDRVADFGFRISDFRRHRPSQGGVGPMAGVDGALGDPQDDRQRQAPPPAAEAKPEEQAPAQPQVEETAPPVSGRQRYAPPQLTEFGDALALTRSVPADNTAGRNAAG